MPRRRPGSPNWFCDFYVGRRRVRDVIPNSAGLARREAAALERRIQAALEASEATDRRGRAPTWGELAARWWQEHGQHLAWSATVKGILEALSDAIGDRTPAPAVTPDLVAQMVAIWRADLAAATVNRRLAVARSVCYRARDVWLIPVPHVPWARLMLDEPEPNPVYVTRPIREAILALAAPWVRHTARIALCHGLRRSSVLRLRWEWHDWSAGRFHTFGKSKRPGGKLIVLPITAEYQAILREIGIREVGPVITREDGGVVNGDALSRGWRAAAAAAGFPGVMFKDLRSSVVFEILQATDSLDLAGEALAHSSPHVTRRHYARFQVHGGLKPKGKELVRMLCDLADEVWALSKEPPATREEAHEFDRKIEAEWIERRAGDAG